MDDPTLTHLLRLVDEPAPDPAEFKNALRAEVQDTLERDATERSRSTPRVEPAATSNWTTERTLERKGRLVRSLAGAASIAALLVGLTALVNGNRDGTAPSTPVPPTPTTLTTLPAAPVTLATVESACATYAQGAPSIAELERFAELEDSFATSGSVADASLPDLSAADASLEELRSTLVAGDLISQAGARSLQIAAGGIVQARTELEAGDPSAAARSIAFALRELSDLNDPPDAIILSGCGFP